MPLFSTLSLLVSDAPSFLQTTSIIAQPISIWLCFLLIDMLPFSSALSLHHLHSRSPFHFSSTLLPLQLTCLSFSLSSFPFTVSFSFRLFQGWEWLLPRGPVGGTTALGQALGLAALLCPLRACGWMRALTSVWRGFNHSGEGYRCFWLMGQTALSLACRLKVLFALPLSVLIF